MRKFNLSYAVITPESASGGDYAYSGYVTRNGTMPKYGNFPKKPAEFRLRTALEMLREHWDGANPIEPNWEEHPRWITASRHCAGVTTDMSIHLDGLTASSAKRVLRLLRRFP